MTVLNDKGKFGRSFEKIYSAELELKKDNDIDTETSALGLDIKIKYNRLSINKQDDFPISIARIPY